MLNAMQADHVAAHHEAGHAVGAFLLGVPFEKVALASPGSGEGHIPGSLTVKEIRESNLCWEHAVVARLGPETEKLFFGRADRRYYQNDVETIEKLYLTFFASEMRCDQYRAELRSRSAKVLQCPGFCEAVKAVAKILVEKRSVLEGEVAEAIKATVPPF